MALWMVANLECPPEHVSEDETPLELINPYTIDRNSQNQLLTYLPPHPARGIGVCRYACVLLSHQNKIPENLNDLFDKKSGNFANTANRIFDISNLIKKFDLHVASYVWFISSWTKSVSTLFGPNQPLGEVKEHAYGLEIKETAYKPQPYRFQYI